MRKKQFKTQSKKMLEMMINSIYTHKEIFLRELISNASDAIDKRHFRSLTDTALGLDMSAYKIKLDADKENRILTVSDNGCGMGEKELEDNLGTIARSGSLDFKSENESDEIDIIGQFGVGFYSAFMVADKITIVSKSLDSEQAYCWESTGADGYTVTPCEKDDIGTVITLHMKEDTENENYSIFLEESKIRELVKKYSDYIRYPITMMCEQPIQKEDGAEDAQPEFELVETTLNSMVPLWKRNASEVSEEEYNRFYHEKFFDFEDPLAVIHTKFEGTTNCNILLFIPKKAPFDYYTKDFEKGLQLYSSGVLIMDKCADLLPDYFSFVKGVVDSADLTLNISRETLQHDHQLKVIAKAVEKKIKAELKKMIKNDREKYDTFFEQFGRQMKYAIYASYGMKKDALMDLIEFKSSYEKKYTTLEEYVTRMPESQTAIYYAGGKTIDKIDMLPQTQAVISKGIEVLYFTEDVDEFTVTMLGNYNEKPFKNVSDNDLDISREEEKEEIKKENDDQKSLLAFMKEKLGDKVEEVQFTNTLDSHPVCLSTEGGISTEMQKVLESQPGMEQAIKAKTVLEININHPVAQKLKELYGKDDEKVEKYAKILYSQACLICGLPVENPTELSNLVCDLM
ncbi:MAG: molecular chaperone HtpG [Clostridia bacterium]|nr:molecular chaperone HtpG [Clostridia bacterium]